AALGFGRREVPTHDARYQVTVAADAQPTQPYYLTSLRKGDSYEWPEGAPGAQPFAPPLVTATVTMTIGDAAVDITRPVEYRFADRVRGELRREVNVVPPGAGG